MSEEASLESERGMPEDGGDDPSRAAGGGHVAAGHQTGEASAESTPGLRAAVEAALFATSEPLTPERIAKAILGADKRAVMAEIEALREEYRVQGRAFDVDEIAGGFQLRTRAEHALVVERLTRERSEERLTTAAIETLAIIAYKQPIPRAEIEAIRGVQSSTLIRTLLERGLVRIVGRAEVLGRPLLYGTTPAFLERFGLNSIRDLPRRDDFPTPKD